MKHFTVLSSFAFALAITSGAAFAAEVIYGDLIVLNADFGGSMCTGSGCTEGMDFGRDSVVIAESDPSLLFQDTSGAASFPTQDWRVGVDNSVGSTFYIENVDAGERVLTATGGATGGVALGSGSTLVDGAISVGSAGNLRRIANVADGTSATDAATYGQLTTAIATLTTDIDAFYATEIQNQTARLNQLDQRIDSVGAIGAAMSSLVINPRAKGNNQVSFGMGNYGAKTALALGGFHFSNDGAYLLNAGVSGVTSGGPMAYRAGVTFSW